MPRTTWPLALLGTSAIVLGGAPVRADSIAWGGTVGRLQVHVSRLGFNDGWGSGGASPEDARQFASWARALSAALPPGAGLEIRSEEGEPLQLVLKRCRPADPTCRQPLASAILGTDLQGDPSELQLQEQVLALLTRELGAPLARPRHTPSATVYTLEVFRAREAQRAAAYAERLDARAIPIPYQMYYAACRPCAVPEARVVKDPAGAEVYRVFVGNFENLTAARRAREALARVGVHGVVRPL